MEYFRLIVDRFGNVVRVVPLSAGGCGALLIGGVFATAFLVIIGVFLEKYMLMAAANIETITIAFFVGTPILGILYRLTKINFFMIIHWLIISPLLVFSYYSLLIPVFDDITYLIYVFLTPVISFIVGSILTGILVIISAPS